MKILFFVLIFLAIAIIFSSPCFGSDFSKDTIYFIVVDRFYDGNPSNNPTGDIYSLDKSEWKLYWGGDIKGITEKLPYIKRMGFTAIWLTPIVDNTDKLYRYGKNGEEKIAAYHGYWGRDFWRINRFFGTEEEYRQLVKKAHSLGIKVIFDYVLNHSSPINQGIDGAIYKEGKYIARYGDDPEGWFHHNGSIDFSKKDPAEWQNKNLFDLADLNSENPKVEEYLFGAALKWIDTGIDGFRLDTVRHVPVSFCKKFADRMKSKKPDIFIFGEWSMGGLAEKGAVDFTRETGINIIDFQFTFTITDVLCRGKSFKKLADYLKYDDRIRHPELMVTCIDNHDMPRFISTAIAYGYNQTQAKRLTEMATYILMTSRGIPCIYYGTEQYLHVDKKSTWGYGGEPYNRQMMTGWDNFNEFAKNIKKLADLRREVPAISKGSTHTLYVSKDAWFYERRYGNSVVLVGVNRGRKRSIKVKNIHLPDGTYDNSTYRFYKVMGPNITVKNMESNITLKKWDVGIWVFR